MLNDPTKTVHVPLSQHTVKELQARALELQRMALTASSAADMRALVALAGRFHALAERRENVARGAPEAQAPRSTDVAWFGAGKRAAMLGSDRPLGLPSVEALQLAADALSRHYVLPETMQHPVIQSRPRGLPIRSWPTAWPRRAGTRGSAVGDGDAAEQRGTHRPVGDTGHHILVVDDVSDVLVAVGAFLMKEAFVIRQAANGDEALRLIASDPRIGVLITDFAMPGLNGVELIAQATQIRPNLKALVITGYPNADGLAELPPHTAILVKPFRRDTLIAGVRSLLGEIRPVPNETPELIDSRDLESVDLIVRRQV